VKFATLAFILYVGASSAADPEVRVMRLGVRGVHSADSELVSKTIALLQSCSSKSTADTASTTAWSDALDSASSVHLRYAAPIALELAGEVLVVDEILVPLPATHWPEQLLARSGEVVYALAHYQPGALKNLTWDDSLALSGESPYRGLAIIPGE